MQWIISADVRQEIEKALSTTCGTAFLAERERHVKALEWFFKQLDDGVLVRNIAGDSEPDFHIKMVAFTKAIHEAREALKETHS